MATTQQQPAIFTVAEAERFAALMAGFDTGNPSEAEAMGKGRLLRRMADEKKIRLVDAFELPEIRQAIDVQSQPNRQPVPDVAPMQAEIDDLRNKLAVAMPKVRELAEELAKRPDAETWWYRFFATALCCIGLLDAGVALAIGGWVLAGAGVLVAALPVFFVDELQLGETMFTNVLETIKDKALLTYAWASYIFFGLNGLIYIACCVVGGGLVGPIGYIRFLYHCTQWGVSHG